MVNKNTLKLGRQDVKFLTIFSFILTITLLPFFNATVFSIDDYHLFYEGINNPNTIRFSIESGRWFGIIMFKFWNLFIGNGGYSGIIISYISVCIQFIFCAYLLVKSFKLNTQSWYIPIVISLGFIHVFSAEILTFKIGLMVNIGFSFLYAISFYSWYLMRKFDGKFFLAIIGIVLSLAAYQVIINALIVITLLGFVLDISTQEKEETLTLKKLKQNPFMIKLLGIILGTAVYLIANKAVLAYMGLTSSTRSQFITLSNVDVRVNQILMLFKNILFDAHAFLIPQPVKLLFLGVFCLSLILIVLKISSKSSTVYRKFLLAIGLITLVCISLLSTAISGLFLEVWWMVPRMFTGFGMFTMLIFIIAFQVNKSALIHKLLLLALIITTVSHVSMNHNIASDQAYLNFLDRSKAQRILSELEKIEGFKTKRLYIHQRPDCWVNEYNIKTNVGDMNLSAFCASWSKYKILEYVAGYPIKPTNNNDNLYIDSLYQTINEQEKPLWPNKDGIWVNDSIIAIFP
jgi:hypothetical protein